MRVSRAVPLLISVAIFFSTFAYADTDNAQILENYGNIPLAFTVNEGQIDSQVKFTTSGSGCDMFFTPTGTTFLLSRETPVSVSGIERKTFAAKLVFLNANQNPEISGGNQLTWNSNYFIGGSPSEWRTGVPNYGKIRFDEIYDGIDLVYYGTRSHIEYDFILKPSIDPSKILLRYDLGENSGNSLAINPAGELVVKTPLGDIIERTPYCYQTINGKQTAVPVAYRIVDPVANTFGFEIGSYDSNRELCIDPELSYSTFLGGSGDDYGYGIALDDSGNAYVTGMTWSLTYPITSGGYDTSYNDSTDVFVTKLNANGTALVYSCFLGGGGADVGWGIAVDDLGNAYITGEAGSGYPATSGAFDTTINGGYDAFVTKLNTNGSALVYSTFLGGSSYDGGQRIAVDVSGNAYVTGGTISSNYPTTNGAFDTSSNGNYDAFVTKLNASGTALVYSTFLGGSGYDEGQGIAIDASRNVYVTGGTSSSAYPVTSGSYNVNPSGGFDAFVTKLNTTGASLVYSTFFGGSDNDKGNGIAVDGVGNAFVTGYTRSANFPVTSGAYDTSFNGGTNDPFVTKVNVAGTALVYSTFLGGSGYDEGYDIAIDGSGNVYVVGYTLSSDYPVTDAAYDTSVNGDKDVFVTELNGSGTGLIYSSFLGGSGADVGKGIAVGDSCKVFVTGYATSGYPTTNGAYDTGFNGGEYDAFVTKLNLVSDISAVESSPVTFMVSQPYPNPFNPSTTLRFETPQTLDVEVAMYNILGQKIRVLHNGTLSAGSHSLVWDGRNDGGVVASSGVYFYTVKAGSYMAKGKVMFLR